MTHPWMTFMLLMLMMSIMIIMIMMIILMMIMIISMISMVRAFNARVNTSLYINGILGPGALGGRPTSMVVTGLPGAQWGPKWAPGGKNRPPGSKKKIKNPEI